MGLSRDPFSIHGIDGVAQGPEMDGEFLLEDQQEFADEFAVIFDAFKQFSEVHDRFGHVLFLLPGGTQNLDIVRSCQSVNLRAKDGKEKFRGCLESAS